MSNEMDVQLLPRLKQPPILEELIEGKASKSRVCLTLEEQVESILKVKRPKKAFTVPGRFCRQRKYEPVEPPTVRPCFRLRRGDGASAYSETEGFELLCLTACNLFSNVVFKDVNVVLARIFPCEVLPDGTPSGLLRPSEQICFGDLGPSTPKASSCVSRELVLKMQSAVAGPHFLVILPRYSVELHAPEPDIFEVLGILPARAGEELASAAKG